jgi:hypothetical protein
MRLESRDKEIDSGLTDGFGYGEGYGDGSGSGSGIGYGDGTGSIFGSGGHPKRVKSMGYEVRVPSGGRTDWQVRGSHTSI